MRGGRQTKRKAIVAIAVENQGDHAGAVRLAVVPGVSQQDLEPFVRGVIDASQTRVHTDAWGGYAKLRTHGVRHRAFTQGRPSEAATILPWAHTIFSNLKTWLRGTFHGVSRKHLDRYLEEFVYRFNRRRQETELFARVLHRAVHSEPLPFHRLTAESVG
jgi:transposase-like protein